MYGIPIPYLLYNCCMDSGNIADTRNGGWEIGLDAIHHAIFTAPYDLSYSNPSRADEGSKNTGSSIYDLLFDWFYGVVIRKSFTSVTMDGIPRIRGGASFGLVMMFFSLRSRTPMEAADLSGVAQSIGYLLAAIGPVFFGFVHDTTGSWHTPLFLFITTAILLFFAGMHAGRNRFVSEIETEA